MIEELRNVSQYYVGIANMYDDVVKESASLEFIAINAGITSKQANSDSFMKLSNEIKNLANEVIESANEGRDFAFNLLEQINDSYAFILKKVKRYAIIQRTFVKKPDLAVLANPLKNEIENYDSRHLKRELSQLERSLEHLTSLINLGKTMAVGGKIKAVYIKGYEEKFRIITETMQTSITRLFTLVDKINEQFGVAQVMLHEMKTEKTSKLKFK